ncbi:ketoacyl-ACP synthase III family protein [Amycolatopsis magusensis]|uniref:3-oxoacyl-[acyl-carrier-protein] synthase-3 n=1 Tax=Amycolatopsis magusensis TaxID=882444 RepID=A0ABS4PXM2_9PSEU|nr:ketoacyl-ACP synthase III family protein [Amycolatopsis magusensis]MBP2184182.1 3-oxoacyl-[acyl-carrier-protein] synthase-3 [Amycolatopsis magusensis]
MRHDNVFLNGIGSHVPPVVAVEEAIQAGRLREADRVKIGATGVPISQTEETPPEMAVQAAEKALKNADSSPAEIGLLLFGCVWDPEHVAPAAHVHHHLGLNPEAMAFEIRQGCNGALAGMATAAWHLGSRPDAPPVLVTTADRFRAPAWDRYSARDGYLWGDAASAAVLSTREGPIRLRSTASRSMSEAEEVGRRPPISLGSPADLPGVRLRQEFHMYKRLGPQRVRSGLQSAVREVVERATGDAGTTLDGIARFLVPNMGEQWRRWALLEPLGISEAQTTWTEHGRHLGHTGLADQLLALEHLLDRGALNSGDRVVLASYAVGFTFTAAVVEIA